MWYSLVWSSHHLTVALLCSALLCSPVFRESVSASVFILSGPELKATLTVEGPVANMEVINGSDLQTQADEWAKRSRDDNLIDFSAVVDFEHLKPEIEDDDEATMAAAAAEDKEPLDEKDPEYTEKKRQRREKQREAFLAAKQKREKQRALEQLKVRQDGEPYEVTLKASQEGWYRVCVHGTWYQVSKPGVDITTVGRSRVLIRDSLYFTYFHRFWLKWRCARRVIWEDWVKMGMFLHMSNRSWTRKIQFWQRILLPRRGSKTRISRRLAKR
jgi:hypothetical protein